jgi:glycosyltransferase involved in cell wall biosynthesis
MTHLCSADIHELNFEFKKCFFLKKKKYPKKFIYVGRFEKIKGILQLLSAWRSIVEKNGWTLHFIGQGSLNLKKITETDIDIKVSEFMPYNYLFKEIKNSGCLILPSLREPWGMVVHEFSAAGLPLILSDQVGSRFSFLINNQNGYLFNSNNINSLTLALKKIMYQSNQNLLKMSKISAKLSKKTSPDLSASALITNL